MIKSQSIRNVPTHEVGESHEVCLWHVRARIWADAGHEPIELKNPEFGLFSKTPLPSPSCPPFTNIYYLQYFLFPCLVIFTWVSTWYFLKSILKRYPNKIHKIKTPISGTQAVRKYKTLQYVDTMVFWPETISSFPSASTPNSTLIQLWFINYQNKRNRVCWRIFFFIAYFRSIMKKANNSKKKMKKDMY